MGNCQAVDNATLVIQHPNGRVDKHYFPVSAREIMKINPGHYVALLLTTTLYSSAATAAAKEAKEAAAANSKTPLRVTRIKLLRPTDTLVLGHVYRLVTSQGCFLSPSLELILEISKCIFIVIFYFCFDYICRSDERIMGEEASQDAATKWKHEEEHDWEKR